MAFKHRRRHYIVSFGNGLSYWEMGRGIFIILGVEWRVLFYILILSAEYLVYVNAYYTYNILWKIDYEFIIHTFHPLHIRLLPHLRHVQEVPPRATDATSPKPHPLYHKIIKTHQTKSHLFHVMLHFEANAWRKTRLHEAKKHLHTFTRGSEVNWIFGRGKSKTHNLPFRRFKENL